jgi:hypothetical protein
VLPKLVTAVLVLSLVLPTVAGQSFTIPGYISHSNLGWFLAEEVCRSMRPSRLLPLDPSQSALWAQYQNTPSSGKVVILSGEMVAVEYGSYFHADTVKVMDKDTFCHEDPYGIPEFPSHSVLVLVAALLTVALALRGSKAFGRPSLRR